MAGPPESSTMTLLPGPQPMVPGQMGPGNQPIRAPPVIFFDTEFHILLSANLSNGSIFFFINFFIYQRGSGLLVIQLTPEMEKALLQQVMSLTPEQINLLPPEQRNQVLQLQQMLRQ